MQDMYEEAITSIKIFGDEAKDFHIKIKLHQGSFLSPYLFDLVLDVLTEHIQEKIPKCMFFCK